MSAGLWVLIAVLVIVAVAVAFVVVRLRQRSGTVLAARAPSSPKDPGGRR